MPGVARGILKIVQHRPENDSVIPMVLRLIYLISQRIFPKWQLPKGIFHSGNFPNVKFPKRQLPKSNLAKAFGPPPTLVVALGPQIAAWGASMGLTQPLGSCHLENCHLENVLRKMHLGKHLYCNPSFSSLIPSHPLHFLLVSHHPFFHIYLNFFRYRSTPSPYTFSFFTLHFLYYPFFFWLLTSSSGSPLLPFSLLLPDKPSTNEDHSLV